MKLAMKPENIPETLPEGPALKTQLKEIGGRLKYYMEQRGLNFHTLMRHTKFGKKDLHKIIDGEQYPVKNLMFLLESLQDLNGRWLIYGEGDMLRRNFHGPDEEPVNRLKQAKELKKIAKENRKLQNNEILKEVLASQKKIIKQNRKLMGLLKEINAAKHK